MKSWPRMKTMRKTDLSSSANGNKDETFVSMGTDLAALAALMRRRRFTATWSCQPMNVILPDSLLMKDGESTLLYTSADCTAKENRMWCWSYFRARKH
ncbi:hypothetical protein niasHT_017641 [Heterodera trifolii]|uniref:Uncharacterized protein n=1 Tax=Heterodera trifolii TaxID=157864 RepID=A0ABD2LAD2_9BILA